MKQQGSTDSRKVLALFSTSLVFSVVIMSFNAFHLLNRPNNYAGPCESGGSIAKQVNDHYCKTASIACANLIGLA